MRAPSSVACLMLSLLLAACGGEPEAGGAGGPGAAPPGGGVSVGATGPLVARVGPGGVTVDDYVDQAIRNPAAASGALTPEAQKEVLDALITEEALWQEAVQRGLYRDPKVRKIMVNLLLREEIYAKVSASDFSPEQLQAYFEAHKDEFVVPEKIQVKRIFLRVGPERDQAAAMALANRLRQQIVAQPDTFKELAVEHSDDPYKRRGGDLGYLSAEGKPGIDQAVVDAAFKLQVGEVSQPFEAAGGVNIVTVAARRERVERTFEQMKGSVLRKLKNERYKELTDAYVAQVKGAFDVEVDQAALAAIDLEAARRTRMGAGPEGEDAPAEEPFEPEVDPDHEEHP